MKSTSLTKQTVFLIAGRIFALPLAFIVPVILVRYFSMTEFGHYKQLFLLFYLILPIMDLGISNSLFYFIPKYPTNKNLILSQTFSLQLFICLIIVICFFLFKNEIAALLGEKNNLSDYIPYIGLFAGLWHFSTILEIVLIVEKKAFIASIITFSSDTLRSLLSIAVVIFFNGGLKELLIYALIITGILRTSLLIIYLSKMRIHFFGALNIKFLSSQLSYALPFGMAIIVAGFVERSHEYIVSITTNASEFAIYSVGCFQLPLLSIVVSAVARASLVRMTELTSEKDGSIRIASIISASIRKLWVLFFPVFVFLFLNANEFIIILFTENYTNSIPIFRIFIIMIPLAAIAIKHVPRVFAETKFILKNNIIRLIISVIFCVSFNKIWGPVGAAFGYVLALVIWKIVLFIKCKKMIKVDLKQLIPLKSLVYISSMTVAIGCISYLPLKNISLSSMLFSFVTKFFIFSLLCLIFFWKYSIFVEEEKRTILTFIEKFIPFKF